MSSVPKKADKLNLSVNFLSIAHILDTPELAHEGEVLGDFFEFVF